jgi:hypothetical protein
MERLTLFIEKGCDAMLRRNRGGFSRVPNLVPESLRLLSFRSQRTLALGVNRDYFIIGDREFSFRTFSLIHMAIIMAISAYRSRRPRHTFAKISISTVGAQRYPKNSVRGEI